jgi:hypothetical protein
MDCRAAHCSQGVQCNPSAPVEFHRDTDPMLISRPGVGIAMSELQQDQPASFPRKDFMVAVLVGLVPIVVLVLIFSSLFFRRLPATF